MSQASPTNVAFTVLVWWAGDSVHYALQYGKHTSAQAAVPLGPCHKTSCSMLDTQHLFFSKATSSNNTTDTFVAILGQKSIFNPIAILLS